MKKLLLSLFFLTLAPTVRAHVGGVDGGGGKAVVCRDANGKIKSAETLDLYEGRAMYGLHIQKSLIPFEMQLEEKMKLIPEYSSRAVVELFVKEVKTAIHFTPPDTELKLIDDSFEVLWPKGCSAEQLAIYRNDNLILLNSDIWSQLNPSDQAALILHEALYRENRIRGAIDSRSARHAVAELFDARTKWEDLRKDRSQDYLSCETSSHNTLFWAFKNSDSTWTLQFRSVGHSQLRSLYRAEISDRFDFNEAKNFPILFGQPDRVLETQVSQTRSNFENSDLITISRRGEAVTNTDGTSKPNYYLPVYYLSWKSGTHPGAEAPEEEINCSLQGGF